MESLPGSSLKSERVTEGGGSGCVAERGRERDASKFFGLRRVKVWECEQRFAFPAEGRKPERPHGIDPDSLEVQAPVQ